MVAPHAPREFFPGQPVRLLVGCYAVLRVGDNVAGADNLTVSASRRGHSESRPPARWLSSRESFAFVRYRGELPGSVAIRDAAGLIWYVAEGFVAADARRESAA